jgi:Fic family protein
MQVDARALARAEVRHETGERVGPETAEVLANVDAMQFAVEEAAADDLVTIDHLSNIHHALLVSSKPEIAGVFRTSQNWIGGNDYNPCGADFVPPPPETIHPLLEDLVAFSNDDSLPPLVQSAIAHAQFETIHPFDDGNGRTGRALIQVILRRRALAPAYVPPISVVLARDRDRYIESLTRFRKGDEAHWFEQFAVAAARAADLAREYLEKVVALQLRWREQLTNSANPRSNAAAWALIDVLPAHPVITAGVAAAVTGRSRPAVDQAIRQLVEAGALSPLSEAARNRSWEVVGLLDLLSGLEEGRPATYL